MLPPALNLNVKRHGQRVPAVGWLPGSPRAIVLAGHGGSGHKQSAGILAIASAFHQRGIAVLAIDGPVHGERRPDGSADPAVAKEAFRSAWRQGTGHLSMAQDFSCALEALCTQEGLHDLPVGYIGVSMGTAYGIPLLAAEPRISVAAIGLWSAAYPRSEHLLEHARRIRCRVWFTQQWHDEIIDRAGAADLFDAIGSSDKRLVAYPGGHRELEGERLADAVRFVAESLVRA
ncbi:MAG: alpha/beta hydrolase [Ramlibacter sp.]|jgi:alpha-beta hydrolase superfamily lysophospholipase|nr:alpha/beta hydrolase [Ramlibacter sp.]MDF2466951.1 alpha/beta hydrolase [Ramlibacter sp.]